MNLKPLILPEKLQNLQNQILHLRQNQRLELQNGDVGYASAPSNIALIKYWGKHPHLSQVALNSSLSFTLAGFRSRTKVAVLGRFIENEQERARMTMAHQGTWLNAKMERWLSAILAPYAPEIGLHIESENNFPSSCGIASSASGYAALCGAIADVLQLEKHFSPDDLQYWLCQWARLGSGSALRSAWLDAASPFIEWEVDSQQVSSAQAVDFHGEWKKLKHAVFLLDGREKKVSSSDGHQLVFSSPFYAFRASTLEGRLQNLKRALREFDFTLMQSVVEEEALSMHMVMHTSTPAAAYFTHEVGAALAAFMELRQRTPFPAFWTLDAGPNIHILYLEGAEPQIETLREHIQQKLDKRIDVLHNASCLNTTHNSDSAALRLGPL